jgi:hypothetical protein
VLVAVVAIFALAWMWRNSAGGDVPEEAMHHSTPDKLAPSPSVVLSINASRVSPALPAARTANESATAKEFATAKGLKPLYDRLAAQGAAATPDAKYYLYRILSGCATRTDQPDGGRLDSVADQRQRLEALIPTTSRDRAKRLASFDEITVRRCDGMEKVGTTKAELDKLLSDAAAAGDPKARALIAARELTSKPMVPSPDGMTGPSISDAQLRTLQEAVASRDPEAIMIAGSALSSSYRDVVPEIGPNHDEMQGRAAYEAWNLVACEFGLECGSSSRSLQTACAFSGQCAASTVQDQVYYYGVTPYEAQLLDQYRQVFRNAATNNDWSGITFARRPNTSGNRYMFGPP